MKLKLNRSFIDKKKFSFSAHHTSTYHIVGGSFAPQVCIRSRAIFSMSEMEQLKAAKVTGSKKDSGGKSFGL